MMENDTPEQSATPLRSATPGATATPQPQSATVNDLQSLLDEFARETAPKEPPQKASPAPAQKVEAAPEATPNTDPLSVGFADLAMRQQLDKVTGVVQGLYAHQKYQQDRADFENIVSMFDKEARDRGYAISEEYTRRWLIAESQLNPQLTDAFDKRYATADNQRRAEKLVRRAREKFLAAAKAEPDPQATADRAAVTWAMRNPRSSEPPAKPVRYGDLTDAEFAAEKKKLGIG